MNNLKFLRTTKNISQSKLQMHTGINRSVLSGYETGKLKPTIKNLVILADYYETSVDFLLGLTSQQKPWKRTGK